VKRVGRIAAVRGRVGERPMMSVNSTNELGQPW
jgi:hypothetical protein